MPWSVELEGYTEEAVRAVRATSVVSAAPVLQQFGIVRRSFDGRITFMAGLANVVPPPAEEQRRR